MFKSKELIFNYIHKDIPPQDVWYHYYNEKDENKDCYIETNCDFSQEDDKIFIYECSFILLINSAIRISEKTPKLLHSFCFFHNCSTSNEDGGAIDFRCNSSIVQNRFCSINALIGRNHFGIHSCTDMIEFSNNLNIIVESCISLCGGVEPRYTIFAVRGSCGFFSSNVSKNFVYCGSGIGIFGSNGCGIINFSTFENNYAHGFICLNHCSAMSHEFLCNIVNNTQEEDDFGCISTDGDLIVENCTILGEYGSGKPFSTESIGNKITILFCNLDKLEVVHSWYGTHTESNNHFTNELKTLYHISTRECHAINDINNANNQPNQDNIYCSLELREETFVLDVFPTFYQIFEILSLSILFETK